MTISERQRSGMVILSFIHGRPLYKAIKLTADSKLQIIPQKRQIVPNLLFPVIYFDIMERKKHQTEEGTYEFLGEKICK
ncbi:MAG: hypothetical protein K2H41_02430 [Acetatifactor sp.]|nr:hypothetical protein [Acetatifactor sp.]